MSPLCAGSPAWLRGAQAERGGNEGWKELHMSVLINDKRKLCGLVQPSHTNTSL